jgi:hypothetical protein
MANKVLTSSVWGCPANTAAAGYVSCSTC